MLTKLLSAAVILAIIVLLSPYVALAQAADTQITLDPIIAHIAPYLVAACSAVIAAALAWLAKKFNDWTGIAIEARHREALQSALLNGARFIIAKGLPVNTVIDVKNKHLAVGAQFVINSVPDAVNHFGLSPEDIERHLIPKLEQLVVSK